VSDRYPHVVIGPNSSNRCSFCLCRFDDFSRLGECPIRLRQALNDAQAVIAEDDETARLFLDNSPLSVARLTAARDARKPHVAAHKARQGKP